MSNKQKCMNSLGQCLENPIIRITHIDQIIKADHLICRHRIAVGGRLDRYDHHVIVRDVDYVDNILKLTGFDGPFPEGKKVEVVTKTIDYADLEGSLYKVKYVEGEAFKRGEVLKTVDRMEREYQQMADLDREFKPFNNSEQFAYCCKTGNRKSVQVKNLERLDAGLSANTIKDLAKLPFINLKDKIIPYKVKTRSAVAGGIIEAVFTSDDIYRYYEMMQKGAIDKNECIELVSKRLFIGVTTVASAEACSTAGFYAGVKLGSIAGFSVAGPVGLILGGMFGYISGKLAGKPMGQEAVAFCKDVAENFSVVVALGKKY